MYEYTEILNKNSLFRLQLETVLDLFSFSVRRAPCEQGLVSPRHDHCGEGTQADGSDQ